MSEIPKVSVILPIFKVEKYLSKCLESLLGSTMREIEIICVNDGSPDASIDVLEKYAGRDKRMVILNQENQGPGAARNFGLVHAKGECVHFCDPDDFIVPNMYEKLYAYMLESDSDVVCSGTSFEYKVHSSRKRDDEEYYTVKYAGVQSLVPEMISTVDGVVWNKLFRRSFLNRHRIRFAETRNYEDLIFKWFWMTSHPRIYFTNEKFYTYVRRDGSFVSKILSGESKHHEDVLVFMERVYHHLETTGILKQYQFYFWNELYKNISWFFTYLSVTQQESITFKSSYILRSMNFGCLAEDASAKEYRFFRSLACGEVPHKTCIERSEPQFQRSIYVLGVPVLRLKKKIDSIRVWIFGFIPLVTLKVSSRK
jgi:glycosyltransferase involved in cell wall biosynthesis